MMIHKHLSWRITFSNVNSNLIKWWCVKIFVFKRARWCFLRQFFYNKRRQKVINGVLRDFFFLYKTRELSQYSSKLNYGLPMHCHLHNRPNSAVLPQLVAGEPQFAIFVQQTRTIKVLQRMPGLDQIADKKVKHFLWGASAFYGMMMCSRVFCGPLKGLENNIFFHFSSSKLLKLRVRQRPMYLCERVFAPLHVLLLTFFAHRRIARSTKEEGISIFTNLFFDWDFFKAPSWSCIRLFCLKGDPETH